MFELNELHEPCYCDNLLYAFKKQTFGTKWIYGWLSNKGGQIFIYLFTQQKIRSVGYLIAAIKFLRFSIFFLITRSSYMQSPKDRPGYIMRVNIAHTAEFGCTLTS